MIDPERLSAFVDYYRVRKESNNAPSRLSRYTLTNRSMGPLMDYISSLIASKNRRSLVYDIPDEIYYRLAEMSCYAYQTVITPPHLGSLCTPYMLTGLFGRQNKGTATQDGRSLFERICYNPVDIHSDVLPTEYNLFLLSLVHMETRLFNEPLKRIITFTDRPLSKPQKLGLSFLTPSRDYSDPFFVRKIELMTTAPSNLVVELWNTVALAVRYAALDQEIAPEVLGKLRALKCELRINSFYGPSEDVALSPEIEKVDDYRDDSTCATVSGTQETIDYNGNPPRSTSGQNSIGDILDHNLDAQLSCDRLSELQTLLSTFKEDPTDGCSEDCLTANSQLTSLSNSTFVMPQSNSNENACQEHTPAPTQQSVYGVGLDVILLGKDNQFAFAIDNLFTYLRGYVDSLRVETYLPGNIFESLVMEYKQARENKSVPTIRCYVCSQKTYCDQCIAMDIVSRYSPKSNMGCSKSFLLIEYPGYFTSTFKPTRGSLVEHTVKSVINAAYGLLGNRVAVTFVAHSIGCSLALTSAFMLHNLFRLPLNHRLSTMKWKQICWIQQQRNAATDDSFSYFYIKSLILLSPFKNVKTFLQYQIGKISINPVASVLSQLIYKIVPDTVNWDNEAALRDYLSILKSDRIYKIGFTTPRFIFLHGLNDKVTSVDDTRSLCELVNSLSVAGGHRISTEMYGLLHDLPGITHSTILNPKYIALAYTST